MDIQLHDNELRMLIKALRSPLHRYIIAIIDNQNTYLDFYEWLKNNSPRPVHEINITGNRYREIIEPLKLVGNEVALIPDFDWLFIKGNDDIAISINLKRDFLAARNDKALTFYDDETRLFEELYDAFPSNVSFKNGLAISYAKLGVFYKAHRSDIVTAHNYFQQAEALWEELSESAPAYVEFQRYLRQVRKDLSELPQS